MNSGWTNKDWKWLTSILVTVIILSFSFWLSDYSINFNIISSSVSIALAIIAISMSMQQSKDNQRTLTSVTNMRNEVINHIKDVGVKVDKISMTDITDLVQILDEKKKEESDKGKQNEQENVVQGETVKTSKEEEEKIKLYNKFLEFSTLGESNRKYKYQIKIRVENSEETMEFISKIIAKHFKGENILYNKVGKYEYEFVFVSDIPELYLQGDWIKTVLQHQSAEVLGIFQIG
ncbi:hypothetical protein [Oceanobacillus polygoni]|uniref:Ribosomal protein L31E n=1 Tax=Oceanobacillus polygoni TaxID=1235259 RepID=A0A9X0YSJ2_9BACI|nr:hypothetical protein [Oceanobacillus polygoni]MBP2077317.1 ribosomal protein L31E [Oceanobacillus polygoni]